MALKVGELFASFNLDTSGISGAISSAEKQMQSLGKGLAIGGAAMTAAVTVPIKKAAGEIYEAGTGFDAQMSKVFAIAGKSVTEDAKAMESLRSKALEMGSTTQFTASQAGEAMEYMAMAGWKTEEMLAAIGPLMNLAAAAGEDLGTTSDIVTDAMTAFGLAANGTTKILKNGVEVEVNNVTHFADVLAAISSNANTNVSMLGESFKYCGAIAGTMGYSVEDVAVALGIMANSGIKASQAGTSLRRIMTSLNGNIEIEGKNLGKVTIATANADGTMREFSDILADCRKAFAGLTDSEKTSAAKALVGQNAMSAFLTLMNVTEEDLLKLTEAMDECTGASEDMAQTMLDNAKGDVTLFKSAVEGLEITLWGLAEDGFRKAMQGATGFVDSFRTASKETQLGTLRLAGLAAAAGPVMAAMGGIIAFMPKLTKTFTAVSGPAGLLTIGMIALGAAAIDSGNTMGKTFATGAKKAGDKMRQLGLNTKKQLPTITSNMQQFLGSLRTGIMEGLPNIISGLSDVLTTGIKAISANMGDIASVSQAIVKSLAYGIKRNASEIVGSTIDLLFEMSKALISNIPVVLEGMSGVITALVKEVNKADWSEIGNGLGDSIKDSLGGVETWFKQLAMGEKYTESASWSEVGAALVENILDGMKTASMNLRDFIGSLMLGDDYNPEDDWSTYGEKVIDKVFQGADDAMAGASDFVSGVMEALSSVFSDANIGDAADTLSGIVSRIITAAVNEIPKLTQHAGTILTKIGELIFGKEGSEGLASSAVSGASTLATSIVNAIVAGIPKIGDAAKMILEAIAGILAPENIQNFGSSAESLAENLLKGIADAIGSVGGAAADILTAIKDVLFGADADGDSTVSAGVDALTGIMETIFDTVSTEVVPTLGESIGGIITAIADFFTIENMKKLGDSMGNLGAAIIKGIADVISSIVDAVTGIADGSDVSKVLEGAEAGIQSFAEKIIEALAYAIPRIVDAGGKLLGSLADLFSADNFDKWISGATDLASGIIESITSAFTDDSESGTAIEEGLSGLIQSIVAGLVDAIGRLPEIIDGALSVGAQIANAIMGSISTALVDIDKSGIGTSLGSAAVDLVKKLLGSITNFSTNPDVVGFVTNLGEGIKGALGTIGDILGSFCGELVKYLFSVQGVTDIFNAGTNIAKLLIKGMFSAIGGVLDFGREFVEGILESFGLIDHDVRLANAAAKDTANALYETAQKAFYDVADNEWSTDGSVEGDAFQKMAMLALFGKGSSGIDNEITHTVDENIKSWVEIAEGIINENVDWPNEKSFNDWAGSMWNGLVFFNGELTAEDAKGIVAPYLETLGIAADYLNDEFYQILTDSVKNPAYYEGDVDFWGYLLTAMFGDSSKAENAEKTAEQQAIEAAEELGAIAKDAVDQVKENVANDLDKSGNDEGIIGFKTYIEGEKGPAEDAAAEVSDAVVQAFLLTMSEENGSAIATAFIGGIIAILEDGTLLAVAETLASECHETVRSILSTGSGRTIGCNFGIGLANGIAAMQSAVTSAASNLGSAAVSSLSYSIREGSPSKITRETGMNFDRGFINGILAGMTDAEHAAVRIGNGAVYSLDRSIGAIGGAAADEMSIPIKYHRSEAEVLAAENEKTAQQYAAAIADALNGTKVEMDGEQVGILVMPTVSEMIAEDSIAKRWGTE